MSESMELYYRETEIYDQKILIGCSIIDELTFPKLFSSIVYAWIEETEIYYKPKLNSVTTFTIFISSVEQNSI